MTTEPYLDGLFDPDRPIHLTPEQAAAVVATLAGLDISTEAAAVVEDLERQIERDTFGGDDGGEGG
jgi:hypothetical protein